MEAHDSSSRIAPNALGAFVVGEAVSDVAKRADPNPCEVRSRAENGALWIDVPGGPP